MAVAVSLTWQIKAFLATPPSVDVADALTYTVPAQNLAHGRGLVAPDELSYHHGDAGCILQGRSRHLCRIDDATLDHIFVLACQYIVAIVFVVVLLLRSSNAIDNYGSIMPCIDSNLA